MTSAKPVSFALGEHHVANEMAIPKGFARRVTNFNIDDEGLLVARSRFRALTTGGHSPCVQADQRGAYFFDGGSMFRFTDTSAVLPVLGASGAPFALSGTSRVWYVLVNERLYFSNGQTSGMIGLDGLAREWGTAREAWVVGATDDTELIPVRLDAFPPCQYLAHFGGRIYGAVDNVVYMTAPLDYASYDPRYDYVTLPSEVTAVGSVVDGLYIGTRQGVYFYRAGKDGALVKVSDTPTIRGSQVYVPYTDIGIETINKMPMANAFCWLTREGLCAGLPGGQLRALTAGVVKLPAEGETRTSLIQTDGVFHVVAVPDLSPTLPSLGARDSVAVTF